MAALVNFVVPGAINYCLPTITPTQAESNEIATIMGEVNTYVDEFITKVVLGTVALNTCDNYISTIRRMNVQRVIDIQNAALERFKRH